LSEQSAALSVEVPAKLDIITKAIAAEATQGAETLALVQSLKDQLANLPVGNPALEQVAAAAVASLTTSTANLQTVSAAMDTVAASIAGIIPDAPVSVPPVA
jgi:hypothetical protein